MSKAFYKSHGMETMKRARNARNTLESRLINFGSSSWRIEQMQACEDLALCKIEACPVCLLHFRRGLVDMGSSIDLHLGLWSVATIIPDGHLYKSGELEEANLTNLVRAVSKCIERSGFSDAIVIGGVDVSFNTIDNEQIGWRLEVQLLINRPCTDELKKQVRTAFRLAADVQRPAMVKPVRPGTMYRCLTYAYKAMFSLRSGYFEPNRTNPALPPRKHVRDLPLKAQQVVELAEWLSRYPIGARLILRNIKRTSPPGAPLRLKILAPLLLHDGGPVGEV